MTTNTIKTREEWPATSMLVAADRVCLAAAPAFALMALLTGVFDGGAHDLLCSGAEPASPLNGMVWMYALMSAFHSSPWLKLFARLQSGAHRS
jgi:hypothetical protein